MAMPNHPPRPNLSAELFLPLETLAGETRTLAPGIASEMTYRCFVGLDDEADHALKLPNADMSTLAHREFGYLLLSRLEDVRSTFTREESQRPPVGARSRRIYRAARARLSALVIPDFSHAKLDLIPARFVPEQSRTWFEASRRVIRCTFNHDTQTIVVHLFALDQEDASIDKLDHSERTEQALSSFIREVAQQAQPVRMHYRDSGLIAAGCPAARVASRQYWEVVIAPETYFALGSGDVQDHKSNPILVNQRERVLITSDMEATNHNGFNTGKPDTGAIEISPQARDRNTRTWDFVSGELDRALDSKRPLDEQLIQDIARKRLHMTQREFTYPNGAGPSLDSSAQVVRSIVELYEISGDSSGE